MGDILVELNRKYWAHNNFGSASGVSWKSLYLNLSNLAYTANNPRLYALPQESYGNFDRLVTPVGKHMDTVWDVRGPLLKNMKKMESMFAFYIYKVDKKIFKNTRGKSGKFTFIWKYVAPYKRINLVMFWLLKEMRVRPGRTLRERLYSVVHDVVYEPKSTWMFRVRRFSYNYVYFNSRKSLGETYRTSTK